MDTSRPSSQKAPIVSRQRINEEFLSKLIEDFELGAPKKIIALSHGLHPNVLDEWIRQGLTDLNHNEPETLYARLAWSWYNKVKNEVNGCLKDVRETQRGHWGAQWVLERKYWRYFGNDAKMMEMAEEIEALKQQLKNAEKGERNAVSEGNESKES